MRILFASVAITALLYSQAVAQERPRVVQPTERKLALDVKATLVGHERQVEFVAFSPNGELLATASYEEKETRLWNTTTAQLIASCDGITPLFSPDGQVLLTTTKKTVKLWDAFTGKPKFTLAGHERDITAATFSRDGSKLATGSEDGTVKLWDVATGRNSATLPVWKVKKIARFRIISRAMHIPINVYVKFSPDQQTVLTNIYWEESAAKLWDVEPGRLRAELSGPTVTVLYDTKEAGVSSANFSPDGKFIATESSGKMRLWETATGKLIDEFDCLFSAPDFSPDSKWLGFVRMGKEIGILNLDTLKVLPISDVNTDYLNQQVFSPDSQTCVLGSGYKPYSATLIDVSTGRVKAKIPLVSKWGFDLISEYQKDVDILSFDPSSKFLMGANHNSIRMWDVSSGALAWSTIEGRDPARFSSDGKQLVTVGKDKKTVLLWSVASN